MPSIAFLEGVGGGTAHYRCRTPGGALARAGWDVSYIEDDDDSWGADVLVVNRFVADWLPAALRELKRRTRTLVVYDIDDWYEEIPGYNRASRNIQPEQHDLIRECMALADLITVSTPALAEGYAHLGRTVVLPNYLDPEVWTGNEKYRTPRSRVHVGWVGVFADRAGDVDLLRPWLGRFLERHPGVRFVVAGSGAELLAYLDVPGVVIDPIAPDAPNHVRPYEHLPAMLAHIDVGLVPLVDNRFNRAKSWCKGLEYGAMGVPTVASPSREYRSFIRPGINGLLARPDTWARQVEAVLDDLDGYRRGAEKVAAECLIDDHIDRWVAAYAR